MLCWPREEPEAKARRLLTSCSERMDDWSSEKVAEELVAMGAHAAPVLAEALGHSDALVRHFAAIVLGQLGPDAEAALPQLLAACGSDDPLLRWYAIAAIGDCGVADRRAIDELRTHVNDKDYEVRYHAIAALDKLGARDGAVGLLATVVSKASGNEKNAAILALGYLGKKSEEAVSALIAALKDDSPYIVGNAAMSLGMIGPGARDALPALRAVDQEHRCFPHDAARNAIERINK